MRPSPGPASLVLSATVARRYYLDGRSKVQIGEELGLSRFKVARLLDTARDTGLVRIEIRYEGEIDVDLSARLRERFGLQHSIVVDTSDDDVDSRLEGLDVFSDDCASNASMNFDLHEFSNR